jgi:hypothetical protein
LATIACHSPGERRVPTVRSRPWQISAAAFDDRFACPGGQVHRGGWRYVHPRSKVCGEIRHDRVDLTWADLGAAQDHVVDLVTPGLLALAQPSESAGSVTLRACDRDDVSTRTRRQWVGADRASFLCENRRGEGACAYNERGRRDGAQRHVTPSGSADPQPRAADTIAMRPQVHRVARECRAGMAARRYWRAMHARAQL